MELDPGNFFKELKAFTKDPKKGPDECFRCLDTLNRNLLEEQINSSVIDLYLIHIFEKSNGLISFLKDTIKRKEFQKAVTKAVEILYTLVNNFPARLVESNILDIYALCNLVIKLDTVSEVKVKVLELLTISLEKLDQCFETNDVSSAYTDIFKSLQMALKQKHCDTVKHKELVALGYFAKRYQYLVMSHQKDLQKLFERNLDPELPKPKKSQSLICGFFTGFSYFCESFPLDLAKSEDKKLIEKLYKLMYCLVVPTDRIRTGNKAALSFLANNISLFGEFLLKDYKFWHIQLIRWLEKSLDEKKVSNAVLRAFFQELSTLICIKEGDWSVIVRYFNQWSSEVLENELASNFEKRLAIHCLKFFSGASYKYLSPDDVTRLFLMIMPNFESRYILNYDPKNEDWQYLPDYIQMVANFMQFKEFTESEYYCLQRAVINMIKSFYLLPYLHYRLVIDGIIITCFYLKKTSYFDPFLENIVYQGIIWSCSHQHITNAEFTDEVSNLVTVKNFFPLWIDILKFSSNRAYDKHGLFLDDRKYILKRIIKELLKTLMILINKLNVSVKLKEENVVVTDVQKVYQVEQTYDYGIFLNLVDLYQEIFENIEPTMFKNSICKMIKHFLNKCIHYPLISGFYKLLSYSLKIANNLNLFRENSDENQDIINIKESLRQFLILLLDKMTQYKDELLIACLKVLLESPLVLIKDMLPICVPPFKTVFIIGRSYFPLAEMGLNTLHCWQDSMNSEDFDVFVSEIIPFFDSYLRSKSLLGQTQPNIDSRRKTAQVLRKRRVLLETEPELVRLQRKILNFIGKQSSKVLHAFVYSEEINEIIPSSTGGNLHLKVTLPYEGMHIDVYLDTFVPRIVHLALYSSDRKTRITACELLQAVVMVFLGRSKSMCESGRSESADLLRVISGPLLQLGCDIDQVVQQIFSPLVFQLMHWYTSLSQLRGSHTAIIIDSLMEGITHPTNSCLRDFSGNCIREFVKWTIKQSSRLSTDPIYVKVLIKKMKFFSTHSDPVKKLGAALIFNNIYREIREEEDLLNIFWFEILHLFINSLSLMENNYIEDGNTIIQINNALNHLERVLIGKPHLFRIPDIKRRVPSSINGSTLKDVAVWLLKQTGNSNRHCRQASMNLFIVIAPLTSNKRVNLRDFVKDVFNSDFIGTVYESSLITNPSLSNMSHSDNCLVLFKWMQNLCCALDGYNFVIKNNLHDVSFENNITFNVVNYFLKNLQEADIAEALNLIESKTWTFTALDIEQFKKQKCECILLILKLYAAIMSDEMLLNKSITLWNEDFWKLIVNTIFCPHVLALDDRVSEPKYLQVLTNLLNNFPRKMSADKLSIFVGFLNNFIEENVIATIDIKRNIPLRQRNIMSGLLLLNSTNIHKHLNMEKYIKGLINKLMKNFYDTAKENVLYINDFQETTFEYFITVLELSLTNVHEIQDLTNHLHNSYLVQSMEFNKEVKFGIFILKTFGEFIVPVLIKNFEMFLNVSLANENLITTLDLVMFILNFIIKNGRYEYYQDTYNILFYKWNAFEVLFNSKRENVKLGFEYIKLLKIINKSQDIGELHDWLITLLLKEEDLNSKMEIFYLLSSIIDDRHFQIRTDLENALLELFYEIISNEANQKFEFDKMLTFIPNIKSSTILKCLFKFYGKSSSDIDVGVLLRQFANNVDIHIQQATLKIMYEMAKDTQMVFLERYKIIKNIVPPLFQECQILCCENFFEEYINEIISSLQNDNDLERNIIDFVLVEILFLRIPIGGEERCPISNAANNKELPVLFLKLALSAFKKQSSSSKEVVRLYKCHAYNALASIVSNSGKFSNFYEKLFIRNENGMDILWNGIIDTSASFNFPLLFDSIPSRRKIIINIRDELRTQKRNDKGRTKSYRYIESQKLFSSSLSEDVTNFDFTSSVLRNQKTNEEESENGTEYYQTEIQLDADDINNHECMATVCGIIQHIFNTNVSELPSADEEVVLPNWMKGIRIALLNKETHRNVKLFLVKVIDNKIDIFNHYSQWFLEPLVQFVVDKCAGDSLNYFVTDVICILAMWLSKIEKPNERECSLASEMLVFLISNLSTERTDVFKYNLDLIKLIVESCKNYIEVPKIKLFDMLTSKDKCGIGIHLTSIFLVNELQPWQDNTDPFIDVLLKILNAKDKHTYKPCAETIGLAMKYLNETYAEKVDMYLKNIKDYDKYVYCLQGVAIHYPEIINSYHISKLISSLNQFPDTQKIVHLKIILRRVDMSLDILNEISDFKIVEWSDFLEHSNLEIQLITLKIIKTCLNVFMSYSCYVKIIQTLGRNITNSNALYRNCIYDIAILVYTENKDMSEICKEILIFGLTDEDADNKEKIVHFWRDSSNLPNTVVNRFSYLFSHLYKTKIEDCFLSYVNYFLIALLNNQEEYNNTIFDNPLENCDFEDYRLQLNWRLQHPSVVPLFAETFSQNEHSEFTEDAAAFQLKQTQANFSFTPTQSVREQEFSKYTNLESSLSVNISNSESSIKNPNDFILSQKYRSMKKRFLKDKDKRSIVFAHHETKKQIEKVEKRRDMEREREKKVIIYRNYRKGDFPDIQISLSSVLEPLQVLSLYDGEVAKILLMEIFKGIVLKVQNNPEFVESIINSIQYIFTNSTSFNTNLISTLLDILLKHKKNIIFDQPQLISYVSQQSGLMSIGTLLLEEYLIDFDDLPSACKKGGGTAENKETVYWVKLTELYKELEEWDVVKSIFLEKMDCKDIIQKAIQYESEAQWRDAQELYEQLIRTDVSAERKDFYYESYFKCFAHLGEWEKLPTAVESVVASTETDDVWSLLWDKDWCQQKLLPWYIQAQVKTVLFNQKWSEEFSNNLNKCLNDAEKVEYIQTNFSEELCIMWLFRKDISSSALYLNSYIRNFLNTWQLLNPIYHSLRYDKILQLRNIIEIGDFMSIYKNVSDDFEDSFRTLVKRWENTSNERLPSVLLNESRVLYRTLFINILKEKILKFEQIDINQFVKNIELTKTNLDLSLIDAALDSNNYYISRKYLQKYGISTNSTIQLAYGKTVFLKSKMIIEPEAELKELIKSMNIIGPLFNSANDPDVLFPANIKYFDIVTRISQILASNQSLLSEFQEKLISRFETQINSPEDIINYASNKLRLAIEKMDVENMDCDNEDTTSKIKHIANSLVKLAYFTKDIRDDKFQRDFILYVLRAMKLNSLEAKQLFPCILIQNRLKNEYIELFIEESEKIPTWMFLSWIPQLLANLDTTKMKALSKIILRIAETYPQSIMYAYRLSKEHYKFTETDERAQYLIQRLDNLLLNDPVIDKFLKALSYVSVPYVTLKYYINKLCNAQGEDEIKHIQETIINHFFSETPNSKNMNSMQGSIFKTIARYHRNIEKLKNLTMKKMKEELLKIEGELKRLLSDSDKSKDKPLLLIDYCPWLANFSDNKLNLEIEIPGQYSGNKLPLPQHHIKISGFSPNVMIMRSIRKPIRLTILGSSTKEYPFLIKFGEDIRQDQRLEQLFELMNIIFKNSAICNSINLEILTYQVIPLTTNLGMIQWINETQPLSGFICKSLNKRERDDFKEGKLVEEYGRWLCKGKDVIASYGLSAIRYNRNKTISFYRSLVNKIPWDVIRNSFWSLSSSTESYIALRNNFIKSYAVLCISHWILGIGDRHLDNSLICIRNGKVLGIDFGHAFGTATQILPVPELVPFRLTPHIINFMEPLKERGQFRQYMIHSLRALRANHNSLLATMNVFIEEPSLDWLEHASKSEDVGNESHTWYPNIKINQTRRKLQGTSSTKIIVEDLEAGRKDAQFKEAYIKLVNGLPEFDKRTTFTSDELCVEDQVDCLLDHATDHNLLGRMWQGWMSWM